MMRLTEFKEVRHVEHPLYPEFDEGDKLENGVLYIVDGALKDGMQRIQYNCPCGCGKCTAAAASVDPLPLHSKLRNPF